MKTTYSRTRILVEGAMMIALSTALSFVKIYELPHGGSITLVSMLPIILMSFRHGTKWGLFTAFVHSLIQLLCGLNSLAYCATFSARIGCILLDYILAFTLLGLAYAIAKPFKKHPLFGVAFSTFCVCLFRFLCSFFSGYIVWKDYSYATEWMSNYSWGISLTESLGENALCWAYSFFYNISYMLPEAIITVVVTVIIYKFAHKLFENQ